MHESVMNGLEAHNSVDLAELDLQLVNALQIDPRATWNRLAKVLDVAPSTLSRRWQALQANGSAWVTTSPGRRHIEAGATAFLFLSTHPGSVFPTRDAIVQEPSYATISHITGTHDLLVDCFAPSRSELGKVLGLAEGCNGAIVRQEVYIATRMFKDATGWRAGALAPQQAESIGATTERREETLEIDDTDVALIEALGIDGRMGWSELSEYGDVAPSTARRRVENLLRAGVVSLRCDAATALKQGRVGVTLLLEIPPTEVDAVGYWFAGRTSCRLAAEVLGRANLLVTLWPQSFSDLNQHERAVMKMSPGAKIVDRHMELSTLKRLGSILDDNGCRVSRIPLNLVRA